MSASSQKAQQQRLFYQKIVFEPQSSFTLSRLFKNKHPHYIPLASSRIACRPPLPPLLSKITMLRLLVAVTLACLIVYAHCAPISSSSLAADGTGESTLTLSGRQSIDVNQENLEQRFIDLYLRLMEKGVSFKEAVEQFKTDNQNAGKG